jgi:cell division protein FtsW (lipid II flippase)
VTLALARLTLPRLLLTTLPGLLALLTWLLLPAAAVLAALATLTAVLAALATLLITLVLLARLLFIRIHNYSLIDPPSDNKRVRTKFLHLLATAQSCGVHCCHSRSAREG